MTEYNVRLEYKLEPTEESAEALVDALSSFHPAAGPADSGNLEAWITVQAESARQAVELGLALSAAAAAELIGLEAIATEEYDRRQGLEHVPELVSSEEAAELLGVSRQAVVKNKQLRQVRIGERGIAFVRSEILAAAAAANPEYSASLGVEYSAAVAE